MYIQYVYPHSTEALIMVAQEQTLNTRSIEVRVNHTRHGPRCRQGKDVLESVKHITAGGKMQSVEAYLECHNQVATMVSRNICAEYGLEVPG